MNGEISPGTVFACFWAAIGGAMRLGQAIPQITVIMQAKLAAGEILAMIDMKPDLDCASEDGMKMEDVRGRLEFRDIHFSYPSRPNVKILHDVSFSVDAGQSVALVGHSGCGKSTIINLLMRYYEQNQGCITLDGVPLRNLNIEWLRNTIGIVSQEPIVFSGTIEDNIKMGNLELTDEEMKRCAKLANCHEFIKKLGNKYQTRVGDGGIKLSGGQRQRLAIARALARNPRILLLDEATSALDTESERIVQAAIDNATSGRTTLTIAHRLSTIRRAHKIIVFESGQIVETGNHAELMELNGVYKKLVLSQEIDQLDGEKPGARNLFERQISSTESRMSFSSKKIRHSLAISEISELQQKIDELVEERTEAASILDILRFAKPEHGLILIGLFATLIRGSIWPLFSVIYGRLFKSLSTSLISHHPDVSHQNMVNAILFVSLGILGGIVTLNSGFFFGKTGERLTMRLRIETFKNMLRQDGSYFDKLIHSTGHLTARLATDAPNVQSAIDQRFADVLQGVVALICGVSIAFFFNAKMAPIGMAAPMFIVITQLILNSYLRKRTYKDVKIAETASRIASESIEHVKTVQALTRESYFFDMFCLEAKRPHRRALIKGLLQALSFAFNACYISVNFGIAYSFGMLLIKSGNATPFQVFQVIEALNMASFSIIAASTYFPEYIRARVSAGLMFHMMHEEPIIDSCSQEGSKNLTIDGTIELKQVSFAYPANFGHKAMNVFDVKVLRGQTLALVGPSGSGKSTVIQLLERYYDPNDGSIEIDGKDIKQINIRHLRRNITLVEQTPILFNLSIAENIAYGLENVTFDEIVEAAKLANIHSFIHTLPEGYNTPAGTRGSQLSGGQKQRICIARAIIRKPKILLLDEATSALDTASERVVQEALDKASQGRTTITIAHRLSTIQNSDSIAVVKDGRVVEVGNHQSLLNQKGLYYRLVQKQS